MTTELRGVIPITATPFDASGQVDEASIATLVEFEARCGVHGLNVLGIMGEAHKLSEGERRRVAEVFVKCAAGRFPVVVGTSHGGTAVVVELSQAAEAASAAAVMVAPPIGLRGEAAILAHYRAVARAVGIPDRGAGRARHDRRPDVARAPGAHRDRDPGVPLRQARGASDAHQDHRDAAPSRRRGRADLRRHERDVLLRGALARRGRDHDRRGGARPPGPGLHGLRARATARARRRSTTATRPTSATRASRASGSRSGRSSCASAARSRPAPCASRGRRSTTSRGRELDDILARLGILDL